MIPLFKNLKGLANNLVTESVRFSITLIPTIPNVENLRCKASTPDAIPSN